MAAKLSIIHGDITKQKVQAIVNDTNSFLSGSSGVDQAIHQAAGPSLKEACEALNGCETGKAKTTPGFDLPCDVIIHTVGPVWYEGNSGEDKLLASCYRSCFEIIEKEGIKSMAFPSISTGICGFPPTRAAVIAVKETMRFLQHHPDIEKVLLVCYTEESYHLYLEVAKELLGKKSMAGAESEEAPAAESQEPSGSYEIQTQEMPFDYEQYLDKHTFPDFPSSALVTVDAQADFLEGGPFETPEAAKRLELVKSLVDLYRKLKLPVFHAVSLFSKDINQIDRRFRGAVEKGLQALDPTSVGAQLARDIQPSRPVQLNGVALLKGEVQMMSEKEGLFFKPRAGAFYKTPLSSLLSDHKVNSVVVCGFDFSRGPSNTIAQALERDYRVVLIQDAVTGLTPVHEMELKKSGVMVIDTVNFLNTLKAYWGQS